MGFGSGVLPSQRRVRYCAAPTWGCVSEHSNWRQWGVYVEVWGVGMRGSQADVGLFLSGKGVWEMPCG
jgi:hypothetical protein